MRVAQRCWGRASLTVIRRQFIALGFSFREGTSLDLMANPTPASLFSAAGLPDQKKVYVDSGSSPTSARRVSLRAAMSTLYRSSSLSIRALLRSGRAVPSRSSMVRTFHAARVICLALDFFLAFVLPLYGILSSRGMLVKVGRDR